MLNSKVSLSVTATLLLDAVRSLTRNEKPSPLRHQPVREGHLPVPGRGWRNWNSPWKERIRHTWPQSHGVHLPTARSGRTRWTPSGQSRSPRPPPPAARGRRALLMSKYGQGCPAPPTPARDSRRAAAATVLPRRHLGPCHVSRGAGRGGGRHQIQGPPRRFSLPGAGPRSPYPEASASRGHPNRGHASRALVKPLPPPRRRPAAGRAQAS